MLELQCGYGEAVGRVPERSTGRCRIPRDLGSEIWDATDARAPERSTGDGVFHLKFYARTDRHLGLIFRSYGRTDRDDSDFCALRKDG